MNKPTRRAWSRPELIVMVRSGPEEVVLSTCKTASGGTDYSGSKSGCNVIESNCSSCKSESAS
jgi:hypothetical protein